MVRPKVRSGKDAVLGVSLPELERKSSMIVTQGGHIEITINLPRSPEFTELISSKQKELYTLLWDEIKNVITLSNQSEIAFEHCKSGHVHLHGYIAIDGDEKLIPIGAVSDVVKRFIVVYNRYCKPRPRDRQRYNEKSMFYMDCCYKSPAILCRYKNDNNRLAEWIDYIYKCAQSEK